MTLPFWCLFAATLLTLFSKVPMNILAAAQETYDNHYPRLQQARLTGAAHRALAAHQNLMETYPLFAAAVIVSHLGGAAERVATAWCLVFLLARLLYQVFYLFDRAQWRSISWGLGSMAIVGLFVSPLL